MVSLAEMGGGSGLSELGESGSLEEFADAVEELKRSPVPAVVVQVPTERIVAASRSGSRLLDPEGGTVVGRNFEDFTADGPSGALELFAAGRLMGYEATRLLRRSGEEPLPVSVWLHKFDHQPSSRFALAVLAAPRPVSDQDAASPRESEVVVVGTADAGMRIDRISNDAQRLFGQPKAALLYGPMQALVNERDQADVLAAVAWAATRKRTVTLYARPAVSGADAEVDAVETCQLVIVPMEPSPSCAFVFMRVPDAHESLPTGAAGVSDLLLRLRRGSQVAGLAQRLNSLNDRDVPGVADLTAREWEIVARLLDGDRVPAIASELFLTQSTVRSHLGLVFGKLHVSSQQELLDLLRGKRGPDR